MERRNANPYRVMHFSLLTHTVVTLQYARNPRMGSLAFQGKLGVASAGHRYIVGDTYPGFVPSGRNA